MDKSNLLAHKQRAVLDALGNMKAGEMLEVLHHVSLNILETSKSEQFRVRPYVNREMFPKRLNRIEKDPEVKAFIDERFRTTEQNHLLREMREKFGDRCPSKAGLSRYLYKHKLELSRKEEV